MSDKEELYDVPITKSKTKQLTKKLFLNTLSKLRGKEIQLKDLNDNDKDILNQIIENERTYRESLYKSYTKKRHRSTDSFKKNKHLRKGSHYLERSKNANAIANPKPATKPKRKTLKSKSKSSSNGLTSYFTKLTI